MSKGDKPRPMTVSYSEYGDNWNKAFGDKKILDETLGKEISEELDNEIIKEIEKIKRIIDKANKGFIFR